MVNTILGYGNEQSLIVKRGAMFFFFLLLPRCRLEGRTESRIINPSVVLLCVQPKSTFLQKAIIPGIVTFRYRHTATYLILSITDSIVISPGRSRNVDIVMEEQKDDSVSDGGKA